MDSSSLSRMFILSWRYGERFQLCGWGDRATAPSWTTTPHFKCLCCSPMRCVDLGKAGWDFQLFYMAMLTYEIYWILLYECKMYVLILRHRCTHSICFFVRFFRCSVALVCRKMDFRFVQNRIQKGKMLRLKNLRELSWLNGTTFCSSCSIFTRLWVNTLWKDCMKHHEVLYLIVSSVSHWRTWSLE